MKISSGMLWKSFSAESLSLGATVCIAKERGQMKMRFRRMLVWAVVSVPLLVPAAMAQAGDPQDSGNAPAVAMGGARMVRGTVTAVAADHLTMKTTAGDVYQVVLSPNTQVRKGREQVKAADIHVGDGLGAMGEIDQPKKTVHALMIALVDAEQVKKAREAMGKTFISGTVTAIDELKLTIKRTDDMVQVIQVDEDTSFKKGSRGMSMALGADGLGGGGAVAVPTAPENAESLTLADVKVGSVVAGEGKLKNGVFVPTTLVIGEAGQQRQRRRPEGPGSGTNATTTPPGSGTEPKQ